MKERKKRKETERPKYNMWQNSAYMLQLAWKGNKGVIVLCLLLVVLGMGTNLAELFIAPVILEKVELAAPLTELLTTILLFAGTLLLLAAANAYVSNNTLYGRIAVRMKLIEAINQKVCTTSFPNTEDTAVLRKLERANAAVASNERATEAIWNTLTDLLKNVVGFVIYLLLLSSLDAVMVAVTLVTAVIGYFVNKRINEWSFRHREEEAGYAKKLDYISQKAEDSGFAKDIRIFGMRPWLEDIYRSASNLYQAFINRRESVYIWTNIIDILLSLLRNGIAYFYLITMTLEGGLPASQFLLYFTAVGGFTNWITGILGGFSTLHTQSVDISIVRDYVEMPEPFRFADGEPLQADMDGAYEIQLQHVSFRYPGAEKDTLHDFNLTIRAGEKLAIVGLNGAGKTTLVKLICGYYDPTEGQVLLNGKDIRTYNRYDYYSLFSAVFQQFSLLEATLAENVAQSVEGMDMEKVKDCIAKAGLTSKVERLPQGLNTHIGRQVFEDGVELSGGEVQRLMLARALYKDAPIIVLDEPTAALDPIAENDIYLKYNAMTAGRTSVYISHRLASTQFCDRIILIADGGIAEEGTHATLMEQGGEYAHLFQVQSKYYQEGSDCDEA